MTTISIVRRLKSSRPPFPLANMIANANRPPPSAILSQLLAHPFFRVSPAPTRLNQPPAIPNFSQNSSEKVEFDID